MNSKNDLAPPSMDGAVMMTAKYRLTGQVQNVGFRHYLVQAAERLQMRGWAKNENDGSLIILLSGEEDNVRQMLPCMQQGPVGADVNGLVELMVEEDDAVPAEFERR
ncbi:MAG: acylphosphatase [Gammaproteobacteria bacterium]